MGTRHGDAPHSEPGGTMSSTTRLSTAAAGIVTLLSLTACGGGALSSGDKAGVSTDGSVSIGLIVPTSGVYAPLGEDMKQGFDLYLEEHGSKLGGKTTTVQVVDEGAGPDTGVPAAQKLLAQKVNAVVGIVNSATALGVSDAFNEARVPLVLANAGANALTGDKSSAYVWRTSFSNSAVAGALGLQVAKDCASAFMIASDYAAGKEAVAGFKTAYEKAGGKVKGQVLSPFGSTTNYQPFLTQAKHSGASCVYSFFAGAEAVAFTKQYKELGLTQPLYVSGFQTEGGVLKAAGAAAVGVKSSLHYSDQLDNAANKAFVMAYKAKYSESPTVYAVQAYDAAQVLDKALTKGTDGPSIIAGLASVGRIDSPRGSFSFDSKHGPAQTYYLREVKNVGGTYVNVVLGKLSGN